MQVQIFLAARRRFLMLRISENSHGWKMAKYFSSLNHITKTIHQEIGDPLAEMSASIDCQTLVAETVIVPETQD